MKNSKFNPNLRMTALSSALAVLIPATSALADTYVWGELNGSATEPATCDASSAAASVLFTMINPSGAITANGDAARTGDVQGAQTPTCGTFTFDTETQTGSAEIVAFSFFGSGPAAAQSIIIDQLSSTNGLGNGNLFLANMLFSWNGNVGIPVSLVWDAQGLLNEMDGTPASFTLNADGTLASASNFSEGAVPTTDGMQFFVSFVPVVQGNLNTGPSPLAMRVEDTANVNLNADECKYAVDADFSNNIGGGCMGISPSADKNALLIADTVASVSINPGLGGNPMQDGPFKGNNANFDVSTVKLVSFTDTTAPIVTLTGNNTIDLIVGDPAYNGGSATCADVAPLDAYTYTPALDAASAALVPISTAVPSTTVLTYECFDASGNKGTVTRTVNVKAPDAVITLKADANSDVSPVTQECAVPYVDAGATCQDPEDGPILGAELSLDQTDVDANIGTVGGPYVATWSCTDSAANTSTQDRSVNVVDTTAPVVTPTNGTTENVVSSTLENSLTYTDQGATATDSCDPGFPRFIPTATTGSVTSMVVPDTGPATLTYNLQYEAIDADSNSSTATLTVNVTRSQPVITLLGTGLVVLNVNDPYIEPGMDVTDAQDAPVTGVTSSGACGTMTCTINTGTLDTSIAGTYAVTYDVLDSDLNKATQLTRTVQVGAYADGSNFTMLNAQGAVIGGTNDVVFVWDQTENMVETDTNFNMSISSALPHPFFGAVWTAHHTRAFGPGTYSFDTTCTVAQLEAGTSNCNNPLPQGQTERYMAMTVAPGQLGAHILFDYNGNINIDVVVVWDKDAVWDNPDGVGGMNDLHTGEAGLAPDPATNWKLVSRDVDGDGINGTPMVDGPFIGFSANFNAGPGGTLAPPEPITTTVTDTKLGGAISWLMLLGMLPLIGLFRRSNM